MLQVPLPGNSVEVPEASVHWIRKEVKGEPPSGGSIHERRRCGSQGSSLRRLALAFHEEA